MSITREQIKELPKSFTKSGKIYTRVQSSEAAYMYEVRDEITNDIYYEVFSKKTGLVYDFEKKQTTDEVYVKYPSNEHFGKWAWCISRGEDKQAAEKRALQLFNQLTTKQPVI